MSEIRRRAKAVVAYDGTGYYGFERQREVVTIQGEIEEVLTTVTQEDIGVVAAGRTDAGVHATGQVIHFDTGWKGEFSTLEKAMNALLPKAIAVKDLVTASPKFEARKSAISRRYRYTIDNSPLRNPLRRLYAYHWPKALDAEKIAVALKIVVGEHDFAAFGSSPSGRSTLRKVYAADCWREGEYIYIEVEANSFLQHMMRRLVATLLRVGEDSLSPADFQGILERRESDLVKGLAPAHGLCLTQVRYPAEMQGA